ncbi:hypothetical protein [Marinobacter salexigens]|uniref:Uncharacterized protein n=1 Tax=Marinobacter salexigens TaxID=1925763 RepID=A0ABS6AD68_9GAMM|nr:hypothetical protein [Marinobacter salexigens]MBU2875679.1 hypothetical protein [Marinobacter salexigens]
MTVPEGLAAPDKVATVVGIFPEWKRGVSDIRATYGGLFVGQWQKVRDTNKANR